MNRKSFAREHHIHWLRVSVCVVVARLLAAALAEYYVLYEKLATYHESNTSLHDNFSAAARAGVPRRGGAGRDADHTPRL